MAPLQHKMHNTLRRPPPSAQNHAQGHSSDTEKSAVEVDSSSLTAPAQLYGWKYRSFKLGSLNMPYYASPFTQLIIVSMVCFFCPGMFNALSGMGGGGQLSANAADKANVALYSTFCKWILLALVWCGDHYHWFVETRTELMRYYSGRWFLRRHYYQQTWYQVRTQPGWIWVSRAHCLVERWLLSIYLDTVSMWLPSCRTLIQPTKVDGVYHEHILRLG